LKEGLNWERTLGCTLNKGWLWELLSSKPEIELSGSRVGKGAAIIVEAELDWFGLGACASMTQPVKKLSTLVMVIQNRIPVFRSFIFT